MWLRGAGAGFGGPRADRARTSAISGDDGRSPNLGKVACCVEGRGSGADFGGRGQIGRHVSGESGSGHCVAGWLARAGYPTAGITARRGRGGGGGGGGPPGGGPPGGGGGGGGGGLARAGYPTVRATRSGGRRARGVDRGRGHGEVVDALRPPLRISRDVQ
jgi:hypothetical protein